MGGYHIGSSDFSFPWPENELTWDISDWGSEWDSADNKQEDASSASMVCTKSVDFSSQSRHFGFSH